MQQKSLHFPPKAIPNGENPGKASVKGDEFGIKMAFKRIDLSLWQIKVDLNQQP
jgi:hypothetical protein